MSKCLNIELLKLSNLSICRNFKLSKYQTVKMANCRNVTTSCYHTVEEPSEKLSKNCRLQKTASYTTLFSKRISYFHCIAPVHCKMCPIAQSRSLKNSLKKKNPYNPSRSMFHSKITSHKEFRLNVDLHIKKAIS